MAWERGRFCPGGFDFTGETGWNFPGFCGGRMGLPPSVGYADISPSRGEMGGRPLGSDLQRLAMGRTLPRVDLPP